MRDISQGLLLWVKARPLKKQLYAYDKMILLLVVLFGMAIGGLVWRMLGLSGDLARGLVLQGTELQITILEEIRRYYAGQVIARLQSVPGVEISHDYQATPHAIPLPATMSIELGQRLNARMPGLQVALFSGYPYPWRKDGGPRDAFEREALDWLQEHPDQPYYRFEQVGAAWRLRYAKADRMQASCVACHNSHPQSPKRDWREGDVRGVLEVARPVSDGASLVEEQLRSTFALIGVTAVFGLLGLTVATIKTRHNATKLQDLVAERTAELAVATQRAERTAHTKSQILSTVQAFFIGIDDRGVVEEWTSQAEQLFGISICDAIGKPLGDLPIGWNWDQLRPHVEKCSSSQKSVRLERVPVHKPDGKNLVVKMTISVVFSDTSLGLVLMGEDITDLLRLEQELAHAQKLESIGQLAAGIAHEINTPIQFVGDNVRFLSDSFNDILRVLERYHLLLAAAKAGPCPADLIGTCESANEAADIEYLTAEIPKAITQSSEGVGRVATLVRAMKDFAHPGSSEKASVNLNKAIESTITVARNEWKYVADIKTNLDASLPSVPCLAGEFNQVVLNMIVNSAHAIADVVKDTGRKGTITISTAHADGQAEIRIADTGTGIPEAIRSKIFDPFFTTKEVGKGTGQGLAIARSVVVDKHGGTIRVESEVGKGTTFIIRLPLCAPAGEQAMENVA